VGECADGSELHFVAQLNFVAPVTEVEVDRPGVPMTLVLSSYQTTQWRVIPTPDTQIEQIVLNGYLPSMVEQLPGVRVVNRTGEGNNLTACAYGWPVDATGCDTPALVEGAEALTGLTLTSFQGCHDGVSYSIGPLP
jgi:hypothetical protein